MIEGKTVFLVGGGPSLKTFDFSRLHGRTVLAINKAMFDCPFACILFWTDPRIWQRWAEDIMSHRAPIKVAANKGTYPAPVQKVAVTGRKGFDDRPNHIRSGNNSGYGAINWVAHRRPRRLILLGYDMAYRDGDSHYHDGYGVVHYEKTLTDKMLPYFEGLREPLRARGIEVVNASRDSRITVWPRVSIDEALCL